MFTTDPKIGDEVTHVNNKSLYKPIWKIISFIDIWGIRNKVTMEASITQTIDYSDLLLNYEPRTIINSIYGYLPTGGSFSVSTEKWLNNDCKHEWKRYNGFHVECFDYCIRCDKKRNIDG